MSLLAHFLRHEIAGKLSLALAAASLSAFSLSVEARNVDPAALSSAHMTTLSAAPVYFEAGDASDNQAQFIARGRDFNVLITSTEATLILSKREVAGSATLLERTATPDIETRAVHIRLLDTNAKAPMAGMERMPASVNYFVGNDRSEWRSRVPLFGKVQVNEIYPGVRLVYYANESARLEYDFVLQPEARPGQIRFQIEGADAVHVETDGSLLINIGGEEVRQHAPVIYQETSGARRLVRGGYRMLDANTVGFHVADYDRNLPLVIDPTLSFSTFLGGSKLDIGWSVALDPIGNIYVAGETLSKKLSTTPGALAPNYNGGTHAFGDAFVAKYDSTGSNLIYLTYLGGKTDDGALAIAADSAGNAYITGFTDSGNFPIVPANAIRSNLTGRNNNALRVYPVDAFVAKLDPTGSSLIYSTLLGGDQRDEGVGIALDPSGNAYVTGLTESTNFFPISANAFQTNFMGNADVFVTKIVDGATWGYSTFLGGSNQDYGISIAVESSGSAFVTGLTRSTNYPTLNPITLGGISYTNLNTLTNGTTSKHGNVFFSDAFVSRLSPDGSALVFSTYLGGTNEDAAQHLALDSSGNVYVTGYTFSTNFPVTVTPAPQSAATTFTSHAFVTKLSGGGSLIYSTQFGGSRWDEGTGIAVDAADNAFVVGNTTSADFFATNTFTDLRSTNLVVRGKKGTNDVFVVVLDAGASNFVHSVIVGGFSNDSANGIAVDPSGSSAVIVGQTTSPNLPLVNAQQSLLGDTKKSKEFDAFVGKIVFP